MLEPSGQKEWFVSDGNGLEGPFTFERIRDLIRWGRISTRAYLCDEYHSAWIPIRQSALANALAEELGPEATDEAQERAHVRATEPTSPFSKLALVAAALALLAVIGMLAE
jgi:hypothetical protein